MTSTWKDHPCFTPEARRTSARVHLPVAPRCNIQCRFCDRKFDCLNESRPGVTSRVLAPEEALDYLDQVYARLPQLAVVGIAGPGDPFANPGETLDTLSGVRSRYPGLRLCLASNGLELGPHVADLAELQVSHVTVTVNAVDPSVGARVYAWVRDGKRSLNGEEGAGLLLERQLDAIAKLKARGITVKINTLILPGINDDHISAVAERMRQLGVDLMNCMPLQLNDQAQARGWREPTGIEVEAAQAAAGALVPQMRHCTRCRADAAGLLGEDRGPALLADWAATEATAPGCPSSNPAGVIQAAGAAPPACAQPPLDPARKLIAVASRDTFLVSAHLGEARSLQIYHQGPRGPEFLENRPTPQAGAGDARWAALADTLKDCRALVVNGAGENPRRLLEQHGVPVFVLEGLISESLEALFAGRVPAHLQKRRPFKCGESCAGTGNGCGA